jgi:hypothetical protein
MRHQKAVSAGVMCLVAMMFVCVFSTVAFAQNDVGTIVGVVADQSGAVIPNATVVLTNEGTLQSHTVLSDASGRYTAPNLSPAIYTVAVTATGFEKYVSAHNTLRSNSTAEIDAKMAIGAGTQTVQVTDTAQVLETQSSAVQSQVTGQQIIKLELNGRNPIYMTQFNPGVTGTTTLGDFNWSMNSGDSFNINGARSQDVEYWIDGAPAVRTRDDGEIIAGANSDAVQEMQVMTADYSAEYGTGSGAEVRIVTKSGTHDFHGGMFEYLRNTALIANTWSRKNSAITSFTSPFRYNDFGFFVGGPVWIPKNPMFEKTRDKVFFFINEEWFRYRQVGTNTATVPTNLMRQGNFTELANSTNPYGYNLATHPLIDPSTCYVAGVLTTAACTPYGGVGTATNIIPGYSAVTTAGGESTGKFTGNVIPNSPNGMAFIAAYPFQTPGFLVNNSNFEIAMLNVQNQRKGQYNLDILATPNNHIEFRRSDNSWWQYSPLNGTFNLVPLIYVRPNQTNALGWEWTIKPTMINEARLSVSDDDVYIAIGPGGTGGYTRSNYGWNFPYIFANQNKTAPNKIPTGTLSGFTQIQGTAYPSHSSGIIYAISDSLTKVWGNHTLKFGFYGNKMGENDNDQINVSTVPGGASNQNGTFTSSDGRGTSYGPSTGVALANEMLGLSDTYNEIGQRAFTVWRGKMFEYFAQDNWQVTPKLHLDYGLRLTTVLPPFATWGNADYFDPATYAAGIANAPKVNRLTGLVDTTVSTTPFLGMVNPGFASFPAAATYQNRVPAAANPGVGSGNTFCENEPCNNLFQPGMRKGYVNRSNEIQPRFGLAYQLGPTSVIRAGAGRFTQDKLIVDNVFPGGNSPFQPTVTITSNPSTATPFQQIENTTAGQTPTVFPALTITTMGQKLLPPSRYVWNISYQQELNSLHSVLTVAYVGAVGNHNWGVYDINQPTVNAVYADAAANAALSQPSSTLAYLRPYQGYNSIQQMQSNANSRYKGLQFGWNTHFTGGSTLGVAWSLANTSDNGSNYHDIHPDTYYNKNLWGQADYNIRSSIMINYVYALPFFKGQHNFAGETLGGWEISGADQMQTGTPSSVATSNVDYAGVGEQGSMSGAGQFWIHNGGSSLTKGYTGPVGGNLNSPKWFTTTSGGSPIYTTPTGTAVGAPITTGMFTTQAGVRNLINNPGIQDWNLSAIKTFPINESNAFEFHAEVYDFINHPNWSGANFNPTSSTFGEITSKTGLVRTIQVGLKYRF